LPVGVIAAAAATTTTNTGASFADAESNRRSPAAAASTARGSGLGCYRWVVERTFGLLHQFKRLLIRYDRRAEIHEAFLALGCCLVCFRRLQRSSLELVERPAGRC